MPFLILPIVTALVAAPGTALGIGASTDPLSLSPTVVDLSAPEQDLYPDMAAALQSLPQQVGGSNRQTTMLDDGAVRLDLRGLGAKRTLVLLNGRRLLAIGQGGDGAPDLGLLPSIIVDEALIYGPGASAEFGSQAVGGVVGTPNKSSGTAAPPRPTGTLTTATLSLVTRRPSATRPGRLSPGASKAVATTAIR